MGAFHVFWIKQMVPNTQSVSYSCGKKTSPSAVSTVLLRDIFLCYENVNLWEIRSVFSALLNIYDGNK